MLMSYQILSQVSVFNAHLSFPGSSASKESTCNAGDPSSIPGTGRAPGEGNDSLLQYSCLENPMDSGVLDLHTHARLAGWALAVAWEPTSQKAWTSDSPTNK